MTLEEYVAQAKGKPFVVCMDKFDYEDYLYNTYNTQEEATTFVRDRMHDAIETNNYSKLVFIYHAYDGKGKCIDRDIYEAGNQHVGGDKNE